jgi:hypothetical protein
MKKTISSFLLLSSMFILFYIFTTFFSFNIFVNAQAQTQPCSGTRYTDYDWIRGMNGGDFWIQTPVNWTCPADEMAICSGDDFENVIYDCGSPDDQCGQNAAWETACGGSGSGYPGGCGYCEPCIEYLDYCPTTNTCNPPGNGGWRITEGGCIPNYGCFQGQTSKYCGTDVNNGESCEQVGAIWEIYDNTLQKGCGVNPYDSSDAICYATATHTFLSSCNAPVTKDICQ